MSLLRSHSASDSVREILIQQLEAACSANIDKMAQLATWLMQSFLLFLGVTSASANEDLNALLALKSKLYNGADIFSSWDSQSTNAPCTWQHVYCLNKRVVSLNLTGYGLSGYLPVDIGGLSFLKNLNMSNNHLTGAIPREIGKLNHLHTLDLHNNSLNGSIPPTLVKLTNLVDLNLSYNKLMGLIPSGGPFLKLSDSSFKGNKGLYHKTNLNMSSRTGSGHIFKPNVIVFIVMVAVTIAFLLVAAFITWWRRPKVFAQLVSERSGIVHDNNGEGLRHYTLQELRAATGNFSESNVIGQSSYSVVYKGCVDHGTLMVLKRLSPTCKKPCRAFKGDMEAMSRAKHKNVAKLLGFCCTFREQIIVYEHIPNGTLETALHGSWQGGMPLQWEKRKAIMLGVAKGLSYLHNMNPPIVHGALKASNVILQMDYMPKLTDYCIGHPLECRITPGLDVGLVQGYVAPEIFNDHKQNTRSDCYSYGILLVEIVSGKRPWQLVNCAKEAHLQIREWVMASYHEDLGTLVDKHLRHPPAWEVKKILELAVICMEKMPTIRPCMEDVVQFLVEEVLIANKSTELDGLFIELVMDPEQDDFRLQTPRPRVSMTHQNPECSFSNVISPIHALQT